MDIEKLNSEAFFKKLREKIIPIEKEKNPQRYLKYDYTSIDEKIKQFLENLQNPFSKFNFFGFLDLPEADIIRLAELFVCRPNHLKNIYKEMNYTCSWDFDFKGLIYSKTDINIGEDIYADYKSVVYNFKALEDCSLFDSYEKYVIWCARNIYKGIIDLTKEFNLHDINEYSKAVSYLRRFINLFFQTIRSYDFENSTKNKYGFCQALTIELYMDFIETIVRVSL